MRNLGSNRKGQTIVEVIIAIGLVTVVLLSLVSALTLALRNNQFAKDQVLAQNRSRETLEWWRSLRDQLGWDAFYTMVDEDSSPFTYCLTSLPGNLQDALALENDACGLTDVIPSTRFTRELEVAIISPDQIDVVVTISWIDGSKEHQSQSKLSLKKWL